MSDFTAMSKLALKIELERIEALLARVRAAAGGVLVTIGPGAATVVWRPGGVSSGNVFATWAEVVAAVAKMPGAITIAVDTDLAAAIIPQGPVGAWDLRPPGVSGPVVMTSGSKATFFTQVNLDHAPVSIHGLSGLVGNMVLVNQSTLDVIKGTQEFILDRSSTVFHSQLAAGAAFIRAGAGETSAIFLSESSFIGTTDAGSNAIQAAGGLVTVHVGEGCTISTNMLSGGAGFLTVRIAGVDCQYSTQAAAVGVVPTGGRQTGVAAIDGVTGKTVAIATDGNGNPVIISGNVRFVVTIHDPTNDALTVKYGVLTGDISAPSPAGSFKISALTAIGNGDVNVNDTTTLYWEVINQGP